MLRVLRSNIYKKHYINQVRRLQIKADPSIPVYVQPVKISYIRPVMAGLATTTSIYFVAAFIHEREKEVFWQKLKKRADGPKWSNFKSIVSDDNLFLSGLWEEKKKMWLEQKQAIMEELKKKLETYRSIPIEAKRLVLGIAQGYLSMTEAEKTIAGIIGINLVIFGAWRFPQLQPFMYRNFTHSPNSGRSITLVTSCFSHRDFLRLALNMVALWTFGPLVHDALGREQFVATYVSLGIGSNVISHITSLALRHNRPLRPTLGASGAIYGILTSTAYLYPNSNLFIAFLPWIPIKTRQMTIDLAGIAMKWHMFNHFAHLGGAGLGFVYMKMGPDHMWPLMLKTVKDLKNSNKKGNGNGGDDTSGVLMELPKKIRIKLFGKKASSPGEQTS